MSDKKPRKPRPPASPASSPEDQPSQEDGLEETLAPSSSGFDTGVSQASHAQASEQRHPRKKESLEQGAPVLPRAFGRYKVQELLGKGGFGAVYLGYDTQLGRKIAIKAPLGDMHSPELEKTFFAEARQLAKLDHSGIVSVYDIGVDQGRCYIISNYLEGLSLHKWLQKHSPTWQAAAEIVRRMAEALAHAHAQRVIHRDLKPANIIMTTDDCPVVVDFGLAISDALLTGEERGLVSGTPSYMSPEQASGQGHRIDGRTDIHALGVILYQMLTGELPFQAKDIGERLRQIKEDDPQPPRQLAPRIPKQLERVVLKAMSKDMRRRYTTAGDLAEELQELLQMEGRAEPSSTTQLQVDLTPERSDPSTRKLDALTGQLHRAESSAEPEASSKQFDVDPVHPSVAASDSFANPASSLGKSSQQRAAMRRRVAMVQCGCNLFTSEDILESLDPEEQQELLHGFQQLCRAVADELDGAEVQATMDGLLICFGYPIALEDSSLRAVRYGRAVVERAEALKATAHKQYQVDFSTYIAVHSDLAIVQETKDGLSIVGQVLNIVTQLENYAVPDGVIVTEDAKRLVNRSFQWAPLGAQTLKGVGQRKLFQVVGENRVQDSGTIDNLTPLIGRDREVGLLQERWEQATEGMGQVVLLIGEAGLGKSRLVHTLTEHVSPSDTSGAKATIVEWRCSPQHQSSRLYSAIDYIERVCEIERDDPPVVKFRKLSRQLRDLNLDGKRESLLMASLLSIPVEDQLPQLDLPPQRQKELTFELLIEWLRELSYQHPVLFVFEDLHWADPTTLELLEEFVSTGLNDSILTLLTFRPEFVTPWQSMAHQTQIALNRLTRRQIGEMMAVKAGVENIPSQVVDQIAERTDGVPLFVEEFTKMVVSSSQTDESRSGKFRSHEIPATLQDLLTSRLDRIDAEIEVAQLGAAIGRDFSRELIASISEMDAHQLENELEKLVSADLLHSRGRGSRTQYSFKHALIQDAAYNSMLKRQRQLFHRRIGNTLESQFSDVAVSQPELLAYHFTEAGMDWQAIQYWDLAGDRSLERRAHKEAIQHLRCGLELLAKQPESAERFQLEVKMHTGLGVPLQATVGYSAPEVEATYARARELCNQLGLTTELFPVLYGMFRYYMLQANYPKARELSARLLEIAEASQTPHYVVAANRACGGPPVYEGNHSESLRYLERVEGIEPTPELREEVYRYDVVDPWIASSSYLSWTCWLQGYADRSLQHSNNAVRIADGLDHSFSSVLAISFSQWVHQFRRDIKKTRATAEQALSIAQEFGFAFWYGWCQIMRGWAMAHQGEKARAIAEIEKGLEQWRAQGSELGTHYYYVMLGEACAAAGKMSEAMAAVNYAEKFCEQTGEGFYAPEIHRLRGKLLLAKDKGNAKQAQSCLEQAIELARHQQAKALELRAARTMARMFVTQGRRSEAIETLEPVYNWFEEGLNTFDLTASKRLLDQLKDSS